MKFGSSLLLNLVCVGLGLFLYDTLRQDGPATSEGYDIEDPLDAGAGSPKAGAFTGLDSGAAGRLARRNEKRLDQVTQSFEALRLSVQRSRDAALGVGAGKQGLDAESTAAGHFDQPTLAALSDYVDEINRRKQVEGQRRRMRTVFQSRGLELTASEEEAVIAETLKFQRQVARLRSQGQPGGGTSAGQQREAYEALQEAYAEAIKGHVGAEKAKKVLQAGRGRGAAQPGGPGGGSAGGVRRLQDGR